MTSLPLHPASPGASTRRPLAPRDAAAHAAAPPSGREAEAPSCLAPGAVLSLRGAAGRVLKVLSGRVWLTEPNDPDDHVLHAGQSHRLRSAGAVVIENDGAEPVRWRLD
jgi:Protein of unknown function (DUF2917)